ncbi:MAG: helix-turn-helix domain-containing protein [Bacteroidota bacterium]
MSFFKATIRYLAVFGLLLLLPGILSAQTTFLVEAVPASTPPGDTLYVTGDFNDWNPGDPAYRMHPRPDGTYALTLGALQPPFSYKFTRGDWPRGEADILGKPIGNRQQMQGETPLTIASRIMGWEDRPGIRALDTLRLVIRSIPANTPEDASLFVTGNFNSWQPGDPDYKLLLQPDSTWAVQVPLYTDSLEYKFSRGSWTTIEGRKSGRARFNRKFVYREARPVLRTRIESWEDLAGTAINAYTVFWLMAAIQGLLLMIAILSIERPVLAANRWLALLLLLFSAVLLARVVVYDREVFQWQPKLLILPDLLIFLYAPIFVCYIRQLLQAEDEAWQPRDWLPFLPFALHLLAYLPLWWMDHETFLYKAVDQSLQPYFEGIGAVGLIYNLGYWLFARRLINAYQHASDHQFSSGSNLTLLKTIMALKAVCLAFWAVTYFVGGVGRLTGNEWTLITDRTTDALWIGFSLTIFLLGYFALREPDIFRLPNQEPLPDLESDLAPITHLPSEDDKTPELDPALKTRLETLMESKQPFLNPKLTLPELAQQADTHTHELSRIINQGFGMNFNDFVNSYRVSAFKESVVDPRYQNHTLLAIAFMVGFNSKTAFNRSFKKLTGQTPGEYLKSQGAKS